MPFAPTVTMPRNGFCVTENFSVALSGSTAFNSPVTTPVSAWLTCWGRRVGVTLPKTDPFDALAVTDAIAEAVAAWPVVTDAAGPLILRVRPS